MSENIRKMSSEDSQVVRKLDPVREKWIQHYRIPLKQLYEKLTKGSKSADGSWTEINTKKQPAEKPWHHIGRRRFYNWVYENSSGYLSPYV
jgi:hypothetical protein